MEAGWQSHSASGVLSERRLALISSTSTLGMLILMATVLWTRRILGAFIDSPSGIVLLIALFAFVSVAWLLRIPVFRSAAVDRPSLYFLLYGTSISLVLLGTLLTDVSTQPAWTWLAFWFVLIGSESFVYRRLAGRRQRRTQEQLPIPTKTEVYLDEEPDLPEEVDQQFVRSTDPELGEIIHGKWRARFQMGQRTESIHLSFCPPLAAAPQLEVETVSGPAATTKPSLVVPHGARIDIRLDQPAEQQSDVVLEVFVHQGEVAS